MGEYFNVRSPAGRLVFVFCGDILLTYFIFFLHSLVFWFKHQDYLAFSPKSSKLSRSQKEFMPASPDKSDYTSTQISARLQRRVNFSFWIRPSRDDTGQNCYTWASSNKSIYLELSKPSAVNTLCGLKAVSPVLLWSAGLVGIYNIRCNEGGLIILSVEPFWFYFHIKR